MPGPLSLDLDFGQNEVQLGDKSLGVFGAENHWRFEFEDVAVFALCTDENSFFLHSTKQEKIINKNIG